MLLNRYAWLTRETTCKIPLSSHILTLEAYFTSSACESARPTDVSVLARQMHPSNEPARSVNPFARVRVRRRSAQLPTPMAWSVLFLTALPVSNEEQRASESRIRRCSISYPISLSRFLRCRSHNECLTAQLHRLPCFTPSFPTPFHLLISYPLITLPAPPIDSAENALFNEAKIRWRTRCRSCRRRYRNRRCLIQRSQIRNVGGAPPHRPRCGLGASIFFDPQSLTPTSSSIRNLVLSSNRPASTTQHAGYGEYAPASA